MRKRPLAVAMIAVLYVAVGAIGFVYHAPELAAFSAEALGIEAVRLLAIVAGVFVWRRRNWARWLAIAWIAFHVVVGALHGWPQFATHAIFAAIISWALMRRSTAAWFANEE